MFTEYLVVTSLVAIGASLAIAALGRALMAFFFFQQTLLLIPVP